MAKYRERLYRLVNEVKRDPSTDLMADILATSLHMQWDGGNAEVDANAVYDTSVKLRNQAAFKEMVKDPLALKLAQEGKHLEMIQLMDQKENELRISREAYVRPAENVARDAAFLTDAVDALKNGSAQGRPAELEKKTARYSEMVRQVEAAQMKTQSGVQLSAAETKAMVNSVKKYIEGGTNVPGGAKKAPHFKEAMCVLKEYMPPHEFSRYCDRINEAHPKAKIDSATFTRNRMTAKISTAAEVRQQAKRQLALGFSEDACATLLAARNLSKGDRNALITPEMLRKEKARLLKTGSAFKRAMSDPRDREILKNVAKQGKMNYLSKQIEISAKNHTIGAMQWQMNRSVRTLTEGPVNRHFASKNLATIYVAHNVASHAGPDTVLKGEGFNKAVEDFEKDPAFQKIVDRYMSDTAYRDRINRDLTLDKTGSILPLEYHSLTKPAPNRQQQANQPQREGDPQPQREGNREPQPQIGAPHI